MMSTDGLHEKLAALAARWNQEAQVPGVYPDEAATLESCADQLTTILGAASE